MRRAAVRDAGVQPVGPGCLKNATDIGSRPEKQNLFDGLPAAIVSVTPYSLGAFGANHALRQSFVYLKHAWASTSSKRELLAMKMPTVLAGAALTANGTHN